jgi:hypothetical protein
MVWASTESGATASPANNSHARLIVILPDAFAASADMAEWLDGESQHRTKGVEVSARKSAHAITQPCSETEQG